MSRLTYSQDRAAAGELSPNRTPVPPGGEDEAAPFLCMRLMCSQNQAEVEAVKKELLKTGIKSETRNHPIAESLGVAGIELWIQDERDFFNAANVCARMQAAKSSKPQPPPAPVHSPPERRAPAAEASLQTNAAPSADLKGSDSGLIPEIKPEELEQTSSLLQKEIEEMLECESELSTECVSLRSKLEQLEQALFASQTALAREADSRAVVERTQSQQISGLQSALEAERAQRAAAEQQLERERIDHERLAQQLSQDREELQEQLQSRDAELAENRKKLEGKTQFLRSQEAAVLKLRKEMAALDLERNESRKALAKASADLALEREGRAVAERRAQIAENAQKSLEKQLLEQKLVQQKLQAHWTALNSLYSKVHAQRASRATN